VLTILLHKRSAERHGLSLRVDGGPVETVELETRSFLVHDLVHWCVEAELEIDEGFWGLLSRGVPLAALNDREMPPATFATLSRVEGLVGPLQSFLQGRVPREQLLEALPSVLSSNLLGVETRYRAVRGAWKATPFGAALKLTWPAGKPVVVD
jgi:hypothetical protein